MLFLLFLLIAVAALVYFIALQKSNRPRAETETEIDAPLSIENVRPGGVVQLEGVGPDLEDFDVVIKARHSYSEDGFLWFELEGERGATPVWIEVEEDDELEVSICLRKLKLSEIGISGDELDAIEDKDAGTIAFEGVTYEYEDCGDALFHRNGSREGGGERLHYWDFESPDGKQYLSIERWGRKEYNAYLSEPLRAGQIKVFSLS